MATEFLSPLFSGLEIDPIAVYTSRVTRQSLNLVEVENSGGGRLLQTSTTVNLLEVDLTITGVVAQSPTAQSSDEVDVNGSLERFFTVQARAFMVLLKTSFESGSPEQEYFKDVTFVAGSRVDTPTAAPVAGATRASGDDGIDILVMIGLIAGGLALVTLIGFLLYTRSQRSDIEAEGPAATSGDIATHSTQDMNGTGTSNNSNGGGGWIKKKKRTGTSGSSKAARDVITQNDSSIIDPIMDDSTFGDNEIENQSYAYSLEHGIGASVAGSAYGGQSAYGAASSTHSGSQPGGGGGAPSQVSGSGYSISSEPVIQVPTTPAMFEPTHTYGGDYDDSYEVDLSSYGIPSRKEMADTLGNNNAAGGAGKMDPTFEAERGLIRRDCFAPKGKLGVVIDTTKDGPVVFEIKPGSVVEGVLFPGDKIIAVDDVDTRHMSASAVTQIMARRMNHRRKITVLSDASVLANV